MKLTEDELRKHRALRLWMTTHKYTDAEMRAACAGLKHAMLEARPHPPSVLHEPEVVRLVSRRRV